MIGKIVNQFIFQFGTYILPLLIIPFLINKLSFELYRDIVIIQTLVIFFSVLLNYGLDLSGVRYISKNINAKIKIISYVKTAILFRIMIFLPITILFTIFSILLIGTYNIITILGIFWLASFIFQLNWYYQGIGEFKYITYFGLLPKLFLFPLVFLFVHNDSDAWLYIFICAISNLVTNLLMLSRFILKSKVNLLTKNNEIKKLKIFTSNGYYIFISQASVSMISHANIFILPFILDAKNFIIFSTADRIIKVISISTTPILNVFFPHMTNMLKNDHRKAFSFIRKTIYYSIFIFLIGYVCFFFTGAYFINILFPKIDVSLYHTLYYLLINIPLIFINNLLGTQIGLNFHKDKSFSKIINFNGILNLTLMPVFGYLFGLNGVISISILIQLSILLCMYNLAKNCGFRFINE